MSSFVATAYGPPWGGIEGGGTTSTGLRLPSSPTDGATAKKYSIVAVDPSVIPYGSVLRIPNNPFGDPNLLFVAADTGGAIKGNRIDFLDLRGRGSQNQWGRQSTDVQIISRGDNSKYGHLTFQQAAQLIGHAVIGSNVPTSGSQVQGQTGAALNAVGSAFDAITGIWGALTTPKLWLRVLFFLGGFLALFWGLKELTGTNLPTPKLAGA